MAPLSLIYFIDKDFMSKQHSETTTYSPRKFLYPVFSSLRPMDSKRKGLHVSFAFFEIHYLPHLPVKETFATVEELGGFGNAEQ